MKRTFLCVIFLALSSIVIAEGFSFGVEGGAGINTIQSTFANGNKSDYDFIPTCRFGAGVEYNFSPVTALQLKTFFHNANGFSFIDAKGKTKISFMTIDVPILLKLTFTGIENISGRFAIFAGPNFSFRIGDIQESHGGIKDGIKSFSSSDIFAAGIECGAEYAFTKNEGFRLGCSVIFDISDFSDNSDFSMRRLCVLPYLSYWF